MKQSWTVQVLDVAPMTDDVFRWCLHKLRTICSHHSILPSSYTISGNLTRVGDNPVAFGGFSKVWQGIHKGRKVCIKRLRLTDQIREGVKKASIWHWLIFSWLLKDAITTGVLQGGGHVEKAGTSECRCSHWCYAKSLAIRIRMDTEWDSNRIHQQKSGCKPGWLGGSFPLQSILD